MGNPLFATKSMTTLMKEAGDTGEHSLRRALGPVNLVTLGIGAIIGAGIFVMTGSAASLYAGPSTAAGPDRSAPSSSSPAIRASPASAAHADAARTVHTTAGRCLNSRRNSSCKRRQQSQIFPSHRQRPDIAHAVWVPFWFSFRQTP